jgi:hypothetical protein
MTGVRRGTGRSPGRGARDTREDDMSFRNLSPRLMFERLALEHKPLYRFGGSTRKDFEK